MWFWYRMVLGAYYFCTKSTTLGLRANLIACGIVFSSIFRLFRIWSKFTCWWRINSSVQGAWGSIEGTGWQIWFNYIFFHSYVFFVWTDLQSLVNQIRTCFCLVRAIFHHLTDIEVGLAWVEHTIKAKRH